MATDVSGAPRATATRVESPAIAVVNPREQRIDWKMTSAFPGGTARRAAPWLSTSPVLFLEGAAYVPGFAGVGGTGFEHRHASADFAPHGSKRTGRLNT